VIDNGVHGVFTAGTTGEFFALPQIVKTRITEIALEESGGRIPVYMGIAGNSTAECIEQARIAASLAVDAVTILTPTHGRFTDEELYSHFKEIASSVDIPVVLYGNPNLTGITLAPDLVRRISEMENVVGIKDSSGNLSLTINYLRVISGFNVLAGRDTLILPTLVMGGKGAVAAASNIVPDLVVSIYEAYLSGDYERAREAQFSLTPLRDLFGIGSTSAVMLKAAANIIGLEVGEPLAPSRSLDETGKAQLAEVIGTLKKDTRTLST
jgi:4-hydroxy-tetrahydrodipicolinate synthase